MTHYSFSASNPNNHFLEIKFIAHTNGAEEMVLQLPAWRPGRYELGNFAKNVRDFFVSDENGNALLFQKITKDSWKVFTKKANQISVSYTYYADELNAGSTFVDKNMMYVNPVNCCLYIAEREEEPCEIKLNVPENYNLACGLNSNAEFLMHAKNFHEWVDSPFIASEAMQHFSFLEKGVLFHIWINGLCKLNQPKVENHFRAFASAQIEAFGQFPVPEYHFLLHILPYNAYHGVEHGNSTVITLGPSYDIMNEEGLYHELLGVSSHELYHTWNVKQIRPSEMWPYNYTKENYSRMGYLYEGATTYYGDVFLLRSNCFTEQEYFKTFNQLLDRHFSNFGRFHLSVADSSFDTWLDGYVKGIPERKTSIYTEGALVTFMLDVLIRRNTQNKCSFDDVMRTFYSGYACKNKPVNEEVYKQVIERFAQQELSDFFNHYIYGTKDYEPVLIACFDYLGWEMIKQPSPFFNEAFLGFRTIEQSGNTQVLTVCPGSIADKAGLAVNDFILAVNHCKVAADLHHWCRFFGNDTISLTVKREPGVIRNIELIAGKETYYYNYSVRLAEKRSEAQKENFSLWKIGASKI
ncbi:MAG: M61 family metallopeptidase [Flavobacteriales bacterium]|nr:M61 family metallopeptidase [Flavobacteriales bacterium]